MRRETFSNIQFLNRNVASNEKFASQGVDIEFSSVIAHQMLELIRCNEIADLFIDFPHHAFQIGLALFAVAAKKANLSWLCDARGFITLLKQETTLGVDHDGASNLAVSRLNHGSA
jgi:hypothetical protein